MKLDTLKVLAIGAALVVATTGCNRRSSTTDGPMERTGAAVDSAADDASDAVRDGARATRDAAETGVERTRDQF